MSQSAGVKDEDHNGAAPFLEKSSCRIFEYPKVFASTLIVILLVLLGLCAFFLKPLTMIGLEGNPDWYRDYGGRNFPEISDQDIFYHNVGNSITAAKAADIVMLGPSFSAYAFDRDVLNHFATARKMKFYNLSFIGIRGGEFSRRIIKRWNIRPPLWLINVDDQFIHFFSESTDLTLGPNTEPIRTLQFSRIKGLISVIVRTVKWRLEDWFAERRDGHKSASGMYRNTATGDLMVDVNPRYTAADNKPLRIERDQNCHVSAEVVQEGKKYLNSIGGEVVLTLVPHSQYCPVQAQELADALGVEVILAPPDGYSTVDGGGHLDKRSATKFSEYVLSKLVKTAAYRRAFSTDSADGAPNGVGGERPRQ